MAVLATHAPLNWPRRGEAGTVHQYFSRGGWGGDGRRPRPVSPLTDWNLQPQRPAASSEKETREFFGHWNTAMADWANVGYPPCRSCRGRPARPSRDRRLVVPHPGPHKPNSGEQWKECDVQK